jgi:predicted nucleic acid-binding protein
VRAVLVDTGALVALARARDKYHALVVQFFADFVSGELITTLPVLTEALHLLPAQLGPSVIDLARGPRWHVPDAAAGLGRIAELMRKYGDRPMDFADASLVWAAEETGAREVVTTDRDFEIYRTRTHERLQLVLTL